MGGSVKPQDVRLPDEMAERLRRRVDELAPLGSLLADAVDVGPEGRAALEELAERLANTYPYPDPHYAGQMLKPPHPVAWAAHAATMLLNPNNHALDGGRRRRAWSARWSSSSRRCSATGSTWAT